MRHSLLLLFVVLAVLLACKKEKQTISPENEAPEKSEELTFYKDLDIDSIQQLSIVVSFQLSKTAKRTGLLTTLDSASLVDQEAVIWSEKWFSATTGITQKSNGLTSCRRPMTLFGFGFI